MEAYTLNWIVRDLDTDNGSSLYFCGVHLAISPVEAKVDLECRYAT